VYANHIVTLSIRHYTKYYIRYDSITLNIIDDIKYKYY